MTLIELLIQLFGKGYLRKIMGTRANVAKPIRMDANSPYKLYSDKAFKDPDLLFRIEKKLQEYGPYVLSNKNASEVKNFEMNARRLLIAKNKGKVTTEKPEAEILDIKTKKKVDDQGIMQLKDDLGLPEGVSPKSPMGKNLQDIQRTAKELEIKGEQIDKDIDSSLKDVVDGMRAPKGGFEGMSGPFGQGASKDILREAQRRAVIRQILLRDKNLKLPANEFDDLLYSRDLQSGTEAADPFKLLEKYYEDGYVLSKLDSLDEIIDSVDSAVEAAETFLKKGGFKIKKQNPEDLAEGGRPGFKFGTGFKEGIKLISVLKKQGTDVMKEIKRSIDNIFTTGDSKYDADVVVDEIMENLNIDRDAVDRYDIMDLYSKAYSTLTKQRFDAKQLAKSINQRGKGTVTTADKVPTPKKTLKSIEETGTIDISDAGIAEEFKNFMKRNDPESYEKLEAMMAKVNTKTRTDNAGGGLNYLMGL
tara:strand:- start:600 stop:2024 length:1425 start_codon:yes stop_codon:yes gene_type:complete